MMTAMSIEVVKISATCIACDWIATIAIMTVVAVVGNGIHGVRKVMMRVTLEKFIKQNTFSEFNLL